VEKATSLKNFQLSQMRIENCDKIFAGVTLYHGI